MLFPTEPELSFVGHDLERPECVLACASGRLFVSDGRGGVTTIAPDGTQHMIGQSSLVPNGIALRSVKPPRELAEQLDPSVRQTYLDYWDALQAAPPE